MNLLTQIKHKTQKGEEVIMDIGAKASNVLPENFVEQKERSNLAAKDKLPVIFGKLSKWYADLRPVAWSGSYSDLTNKPTIPEGSAANYQVANNDTTEAEGFVADARIVRTHGLEIDGLSRDLHTLNDSGAIKGLDAREDGVYITYSTGADTVTKKLGSGDSVTKTFNSGVFSKSASGTINVSGYRYVLINSIQIGNPNASSSSSGRYSFGDISADFRRSPASYDNPARMPNWFDLNGREVIQWSYNSSDNDNMIVSYTLVE